MKYSDHITLDTSVAGRDLDYACLRACPTLDDSAPGYDDTKWERRYWYGNVPPWSTDAAAARQLEDEIAQRGLDWSYLRALINIAAEHTPADSNAEKWTLVRATPEQRARAFIAAIEGKF